MFKIMRSQTVSEIKNECRERKSIFLDHFDYKIKDFFEKGQEKLDVVWKRPNSVFQSPVFMHAIVSTGNIICGKLGNKWVAAAIYNLQLNRTLFSVVVPEGQDFQENYVGLFYFRFWHFGKWVETIVDDLLTFDANSDEILQSKVTTDALWCSLLEKAFVKFHGGYKNIKNLQPQEILTNFTGGLCETVYTMKAEENEDFSTLLHRIKRNPFIYAHTINDEELVSKHFLPNHVYLIPSVEELKAFKLKVNLVQLRDPGGTSCKWTGSWSNQSIEWIALPQKYREGFIFQKDEALCWIMYEDFMGYFDYIIVCNFQITSLCQKENLEHFWDISMFEGKWIKHKTAGGLPIGEKGYKNPKFKFEILKDEQKHFRPTTTLISLIQNPKDFLENRLVGFYVYKHENEKQIIQWKNSLNRLKSSFKSEFKMTKEVYVTQVLNPGLYVIVPCTMKENEEGSFLVRIFTEYPHQIPIASHDLKTYGDYGSVNISLVTPSDIELGQTIKVSLQVNNKNSDDLPAMATLGLYSKTYKAYKAIKSILEHVVISNKEPFETFISVPYEEYAPKIDDHSLLCAAFEICGIEKTFFDCGVKVIDLKKPRIEFDMDNSFLTTSGLNLVAFFKNPLPIPLRPGFVVVQGDGISPKKLPFSELAPFGTLNIKFNCIPEKTGALKITVTLNAIPLGTLKTTVEISRFEMEQGD